MMNDIAVRGGKILKLARKSPYYFDIKCVLEHADSVVAPCSLHGGYYIVDEILFIAMGKACYETLLDILNRIGVV